ncbi:phage regulatory CII family protein [Bradyrhizobium sp. AUGA SZCCT0160]|uniref:phage regulatory CII family protein n=1 Tax=Bradyrhizobium sp. AUGA SZCCT0160 TaxID=2807662 RepID=UPI002010E4E6|nr:phage regulatory CII family protein [Bradyrhizobium sp. AUGA SZCCT0160]MBR1193216.1 hypothetical protein [Bradyrhizobium sp. AUGA SZCCT0160]
MSALTDAQYALKAATRRAVKLAGGPNAASEVVRAAASRLSQYGNHDVPIFAPIDVCAELDRAAGDPVILRAWADLLGFDLTPRNVDAAVAADLAHAAGQVARESGELISAAIDASADGNLTPAEARRLDEEAADVEQKVVNLRKIVRPAMGGNRNSN